MDSTTVTIDLALSPQLQEFLARLLFFIYFHGVGICLVLMTDFMVRFSRR